MKPEQNIFDEYERLLSEGAVQKAYRGIIQFMLHLRTRLQAEYPDFEVSGLYQGYMDMSYFAFTPSSLAKFGLKIAIVFLHESFTFQVWLSARSKPFQAKYSKILKEAGWNPAEISTPGPGVDSILEHVLVAKPNFEDAQSLSEQIVSGTLDFSKKIETVLVGQQSQ